MPDVKMIDPTPNFENSSIAIPGLKHHQLRVLDGLPVTPKNMKMLVNLNSAVLIIQPTYLWDLSEKL